MRRRTISRQGWRGSLVFAVCTAVFLGGVPAVAAPPTSGEPPRPASGQAWAAPEKVARTVVGAAPPARPWTTANSAKVVGTRQTRALAGCGDRTGLRPHYPLQRFRVSHRMELLVNLASGNLVVTQNDFTLAGTGQHLAISHVYNNLVPDRGSFGLGTTMSVGADVGLAFSGADVVLHGPSNYCATFTPAAGGGYTTPSGMNAALRKETDGTFTLTFDASEEKWRFTAQGWLTSQADRNGNASTYHYTGTGTLASITDSQGRVTTVGSDAAGLVTRITDPTGTDAGTYAYDADGRMTSFTDRAGHTIALGWDPAWNLTSITDPAGHVYRFAYDTADRVVKVSVPNSDGDLGTTFTYQNGATVVVDPLQHASTHHFDASGRQTKAVDPLGHEQSQTWTANSDVQIAVDGLQNRTENSYDPLNNLIGTKLPTGAASVIGYASTAHPRSPTSLKDPAGRELTREYDAAGNLTKVRSTGLNADLDVRTYNSPRGTLATATDGNGNTTRYGYDAAGNLTSVTPPSPMGATAYRYDSLSRVVQVTDGRGKKTGYAYDRFDRVVRVTGDNGASLIEVAYDE